MYPIAPSDARGAAMTECHDSAAVADALAAVRDAADRCRAALAAQGCPPVAELLDTASVTGELTATLLYLVAPLADVTEPGADEALDRAADLAADSRRHIVTGLNLMAGAIAITRTVVAMRRVTARPVARAWWPGWATLRARVVRWWQEVWMPPDPDLSQAPSAFASSDCGRSLA